MLAAHLLFIMPSREEKIVFVLRLLSDFHFVFVLCAIFLRKDLFIDLFSQGGAYQQNW